MKSDSDIKVESKRRSKAKIFFERKKNQRDRLGNLDENQTNRNANAEISNNNPRSFNNNNNKKNDKKSQDKKNSKANVKGFRGKTTADWLALSMQNLWKLKGRRVRRQAMFECVPRSYACLSQPGQDYLIIESLRAQYETIKHHLSMQSSMEHQILSLRRLLVLTPKHYQARYKFTQLIINCLHKHHGMIYEGVMFGSTVNGLGFIDSDVDLRLIPLQKLPNGDLEPCDMTEDMRDKVLKDIAFQTTSCCPAIGEFVPSARCPVAKLTFLRGTFYKDDYAKSLKKLKEGLKYDISLSTSNPLGTFNSKFLRFLCYLQPKFHLLATVVRYWSIVHDLIVPGSLSSYALINMLIYFCQTSDPPLLPSINEMRDKYYEQNAKQDTTDDLDRKAITRIESNCLVCLKKECYDLPENNDSVSVLLLKFFQVMLNFPYKTHIINTRTAGCLSREQFRDSTQFHANFPLNQLLNIQDPFDFKHNLTQAIPGNHFQYFMTVMMKSYETLYTELVNNYVHPNLGKNDEKMDWRTSLESKNGEDPEVWGINCILKPFPK